MAKSIMQNERECYICAKLGFHTYKNLDEHHCIHGFANRKLAERDGLKLYLCRYHHTALHDKGELDKELQKEAQIRWMEVYERGVDEWIKRYGKSFL